MSARAVVAAVLPAMLALAAARAIAQELVLHKEGTGLYHRPACDVVRDGIGVLAMSRGQAEARGLKAHPECDPSLAPLPGKTPPASATPAAPKTPQPPVFVFVDDGKQYHREGCKRLGKGARRLALDEAAKHRWPCPTCRPPIRPRAPGKRRP